MPGALLYSGPSQLDPTTPIVGILTEGSANRKTGGMWQLWILLRDHHPGEAVRDEKDAPICGDCQHRGTSCYVNTWWAPANIYRAFKAGQYPRRWPSVQDAKGQTIRLGAYGDPAALPVATLGAILALPWDGWTGYTHQWRLPRVQKYRQWLMASTDSEEEYREAKLMGWRSFRCRAPFEPKLSTEIVCPASHEAGQKVQCADCRLCQGASRVGAKDIVIYQHGYRAKMFRNHAQRVMDL